MYAGLASALGFIYKMHEVSTQHWSRATFSEFDKLELYEAMANATYTLIPTGISQ